MKKFLLILAFIGLLSGCSSSLSYSQVEKSGVNNSVRTFITGVKDENGVNIYFDTEKTVYVYLTSANVKQGEELVYFTDFNVEENGETLHISYYTETTTDYSNKDLENELLFKVNLNKKYEYMNAYRDQKEVAFNTILGNE
ncbi:hypothetical protein [Robertmurraya korlensis]|uniref:hypothetical protein n=1 Tax=Robertmurraya korlensis TaxID=519977 RepID=UPI000825A1C1|nr:hypothetical protein [Robertmurraya korlensis]